MKEEQVKEEDKKIKKSKKVKKEKKEKKVKDPNKVSVIDKIKNLFKEDPEIKNLGSYEKPLDELSKEAAAEFKIDEKEIKIRKTLIAFSIIFFIFAIIPPLLKIFDPKYAERDPKYVEEQKGKVEVKHTKLVCKAERKAATYHIEYTFEGYYYNDKAYKAKYIYDLSKTKANIDRQKHPELQPYNALDQIDASGISKSEKDKVFEATFDFLSNPDLKKNVDVGSYGDNLDVTKSNFETDEGYTCVENDFGKVKVDTNVLNTL